MKEIIPKNWVIIVICPISKKRGCNTIEQLWRYITVLHGLLDLFSNPVM